MDQQSRTSPKEEYLTVCMSGIASGLKGQTSRCLAMTVKDNLHLLRQFSASIFKAQFVKDLVAPFEALDALAKLDNKDKTNNEPATRQDVVAVLSTIDENEPLDQAIQDAYNAAGPMFLVCVQLLAIQTRMRNPHEFAEKSSKALQNEHFRHNPTPKGCRITRWMQSSRSVDPLPGTCQFGTKTTTMTTTSPEPVLHLGNGSRKRPANLPGNVVREALPPGRTLLLLIPGDRQPGTL